MAEYSMAEALRKLVEHSGWTDRVNEYRIKENWEAIAGKTIAHYTQGLMLRGRVLTISTDVGPLKQELLVGKTKLAERINAFFSETVVLDIKVR